MKTSLIFNSPVELGLRSLMLLAEAHPKTIDIQRLVILDYLLIHSGDIEGGPESLHPPSPLRAGEVSVRRALIEDGLHLFAIKGLVNRIADAGGISYAAEELAAVFLDAVKSNYGAALRSRAAWAVETAGTLSDGDATMLLERTIGKWKTEFVIDETEEEL